VVNIILKLFLRWFNSFVLRKPYEEKSLVFAESPEDGRDYTYSSTELKDNCYVTTEHKDERQKYQGRLGTCYAFALIDWYENEMYNLIHEDFDGSEMFFSWCIRDYYREIGKTSLSFPNDNGAYLRDCFKQMRQRNMITDERFCRYLTSNFNETPAIKAKSFARLLSRRVNKFWRITTKEQASSALFDGHRVCFGIRLDEDFLKNKSGIINNIDITKLRGGHAMTIIGQEGKYFFVKNSWYGFPNVFKMLKDEIFKDKVFIEAWTASIK